jgi:hypothetical protein
MTTKHMVMGALAAMGLAGCGSQPQAAADAPAQPASVPVAAPAASAPVRVAAGLPRYRCDQGIEFTVRFSEDTALVDAGDRGSEVLLRDAGGATPQQTVYSNTRMRAEFGLGVSGREAIVRYAQPPLAAHCVQD